MSKLGLHVNSWVPGALDYILRVRPKVVKVLDPNYGALKAVKESLPDTMTIYRHYADMEKQTRLVRAGIAGAREFADEVLAAIDPVRQYVDAVEGLNEVDGALWDLADAYNEWTAEYAITMRNERIKTVAYNWSVGCPPGFFGGDGNLFPDEFREGLRQHWAHYLDGLRESDYLGLHEYSAPYMWTDASWRCLRYRRVLEVLPADCKRPILITEAGIDTGVLQPSVGLHGWKWLGYAEEQYLTQLKWYDSEIKKDGVLATIYCAGVADMATWGTFDVLGCNQIADYIANDMEEPSDMDEAKIQQLLAQNALLTQALIAFRQGKFTGADGIDGIIVALTGKPLTFTPTYPKA